jgi:hypothetical protein
MFVTTSADHSSQAPALLIVDEPGPRRHAVVRLLEEAGWIVKTVESAFDGRDLRSLEQEHIRLALLANGGNVSRTARALGVHRRTLQRKLRQHSIAPAVASNELVVLPRGALGHQGTGTEAANDADIRPRGTRARHDEGEHGLPMTGDHKAAS